MARGLQQSRFAAYAESDSAWDFAAVGGACESGGARGARGSGGNCAWGRGILGARSYAANAADLESDGARGSFELRADGGIPLGVATAGGAGLRGGSRIDSGFSSCGGTAIF